MIYKILGLLLIVPFIALIFTCFAHKDYWSERRSAIFLYSCMAFLLLIEAFGLGIYFLFFR
jgi:hypothetical protein